MATIELYSTGTGESILNNKKKVAVIFGGESAEHEVSRFSAESVIRNIDKNKYDIVIIGITRDGRWLAYDGPIEKIGSGEWEDIAQKRLYERKKNTCLPDKTLKVNKFIDTAADEKCSIDVVFPVLHGSNGEDGTIQGLFELSKIPYVGSGVLGSALSMDKAYTKIIFEKENIPSAEYIVIKRRLFERNKDKIIKYIENKFRYPCFVKPSNAGSSVGVTKAHDRNELNDGIINAALYDRKILIEEFINGREVECAVLGNDEPVASTVGEVIPCNEFYDYHAKYIDDNSEIIIPADLPKDIIKLIREYAVKAYTALDCAGMSRVDFFVCRESGKVYINEVNTLPGFTNISMYPQLWKASGIPYDELINRLIELALKRYKEKQKKIKFGGK